jgi:hypothetical protein
MSWTGRLAKLNTAGAQKAYTEVMNEIKSGAFNSVRELPASVLDMLDNAQWDALAMALDNGLPANLFSLGDVVLFERVLSELELGRPYGNNASLKGPDILIDAFIRNGLMRDAFYESGMTAIGLAAGYGQWGWMHKLIAAGYTAEVKDAAYGSPIHSLLEGRLQRSVEDRYLAMDGVSPESMLLPNAPASNSGTDSTTQDPSDTANIDHGNVISFGRKTRAPQPPMLELVDLDQDTERAIPLNEDSVEEFQAVLDAITALAALGVDLEVDGETDELGTAGMPPLPEAIWTMDYPAVVALVMAGADLTRTHKSEQIECRPLELAIHKGDRRMVELFLEAGAPLDRNATLNGVQAMQSQALVLAARMGQADLVEMIAACMTEEEISEHGGTAMHMAACEGSVTGMRAVRLLGVPYNVCVNDNGFAPIHQAAHAGMTDAIDFLIRRGQTLETKSLTGVSAAELLRSEHPALARQYGVAKAQPEDNVRMFARRPKT